MYMTGNIIDGKAVAATIRSELTIQVASLREKYGKVPARQFSVHACGARQMNILNQRS
jgi:uncharacterized protein (DUF2141 family)